MGDYQRGPNPNSRYIWRKPAKSPDGNVDMHEQDTTLATSRLPKFSGAPRHSAVVGRGIGQYRKCFSAVYWKSWLRDMNFDDADKEEGVVKQNEAYILKKNVWICNASFAGAPMSFYLEQ